MADVSVDLPKGLTPEGRAFLRPIAALGASYLFERSCKFVAGRIERERFLATLSRAALGNDARRTLVDLAGVAWPPPVMDRLDGALDGCSAVHFGFEVSRGAIGHKLYFEYGRDRRAPGDAEGDATLVHRAFKWRSDGAGRVVETHYRDEGSADRPLVRRIADVFACEAAPAAVAVGSAMAEIAAARAPSAELVLLRVSEPGHRRQSFDLQLYDAGLRVADAVFVLRARAQAFMLAPAQVSEALAPVSGARLGHVAAGLDRETAPFVTLYFAPERR